MIGCRETLPLLPLFVDGELDARQMRSVALHSTRCGGCEEELRRIERVQDAIAEHLNARVEEIDLSGLWESIAPRLDALPVPWSLRLRAWWENLESQPLIRIPAYAAAAAAAVVLTVAVWQSPDGSPVQPIELVAAKDPILVDNSAILDSVKSDSDSLVLMREPETNTLVLWVSDDAMTDAALDRYDFGDLP